MIRLKPDTGNDSLTIESDELITEVVVLNSSGTEFPAILKEQNEGRLKLNIAGLDNGTYLTGISTQSTWIMKKFTINR